MARALGRAHRADQREHRRRHQRGLRHRADRRHRQAASGTPANADRASANPGQTITLIGSGLDTGTDVVFQIVDAIGQPGRGGRAAERGQRRRHADPGAAALQRDHRRGAHRRRGRRGARCRSCPSSPTCRSSRSTATAASARGAAQRHGLRRGRQLRVPLRLAHGASTPAPTTGPDVFDRYDPVLGQYVSNGYARVTVPLSQRRVRRDQREDRPAAPVPASASTWRASPPRRCRARRPMRPRPRPTPARRSRSPARGCPPTSDVLLRWLNINGNRADGAAQPDARPPPTAPAPRWCCRPTPTARSRCSSSARPASRCCRSCRRLRASTSRTARCCSARASSRARGVYAFAGASVTDDAATGNDVDVYYDGDQNGSAYLNRTALPTHGLGNVTRHHRRRHQRAVRAEHRARQRRRHRPGRRRRRRRRHAVDQRLHQPRPPAEDRPGQRRGAADA